jgi:tartrate-resistant acid phosphatase type 5
VPGSLPMPPAAPTNANTSGAAADSGGSGSGSGGSSPTSPAPTDSGSGGTGAVPSSGAVSGSGPISVPSATGSVRAVVIGDYGWAGPDEQRVAELVDALRPDAVFTTGDNNYPGGAASTIDQNIGQYFSELIFPYRGGFPSSATRNRFYPTLGNHDWDTDGAQPYLDYFTLPGNERYYEVELGAIHFFALDSDPREPDGVTADSAQALWLKAALAASRARFKVVAMHHPPYSSGPHGDAPTMQWPFAAWGADLVVAGHDHGYERLEIDGITYVVSGLGGAPTYSFGSPAFGSVVRHSASHGAAVLDADEKGLRLLFVDVDGRVVDNTLLWPRAR